MKMLHIAVIMITMIFAASVNAEDAEQKGWIHQAVDQLINPSRSESLFKGAGYRGKLENDFLSIDLSTADGTLSVLDRRSNKLWVQKAMSKDIVVSGIMSLSAMSADPRYVMSAVRQVALIINMTHVPSGLDFQARLFLAHDVPEFTVVVACEGESAGTLPYPHPFVSDPGTSLIVPMNEGISYPVDDESVNPKRLTAYGEHGICMGFWGVTDGKAAQMAIIETPDDMSISIDRLDGKLCIAPQWQSQNDQFGYVRGLRYVFFEDGGHVAMCKRYRKHAEERGLLKELEEKMQKNPNSICAPVW